MDLKSPFGPLSSLSSFEELGKPLNLQHLMMQFGYPVPHQRIILKVVSPPVVSPSKAVSMVMADESGQFIILQMYNLPNANSSLHEFSFGSRYVLKNPFLKPGTDGVPFLRVDQPWDLLRLDLPPLNGNILVVGDGDLSFSVALAKSNQIRGHAFVTSTSLESLEKIKSKYVDGQKNISLLENGRNVELLTEVDVGDLEKIFQGRVFESIIWNFPYPDDDKCMASAERCAPLVEKLLKSATNCLSNGGRIFITLNPSQGGSRFEATNVPGWDVEGIARRCGYTVVEALLFNPDEFPGYVPKRSYSDDTFNHKNAKLHIFERSGASIVAGADRSSLSAIFNQLLDQRWGSPSREALHWTKALESLLAHTTTYMMARSLFSAAAAFGSAIECLNDATNDQLKKTESSSTLISALVQVYSIEGGELVTSYDKTQCQKAAVCCVAALASLLSISDQHRLMELLHECDPMQSDFVRILDVFRKCYITDEAGSDESALERCLIVFCNVVYACDQNTRAAEQVCRFACDMIPANPWFALRAGNLIACYETKDGRNPDESVLAEAMLLAKKAIDLSEEGTPIHTSATYLWAGMEVRKPYSVVDWDEAISKFEKCATWMEECDRDLPKTYFYIAWAFQMKEWLTSDVTDLPLTKNVRRYYGMGLQAEQKTLPFFLPQPSFPLKRWIGALLIDKQSFKIQEKSVEHQSSNNENSDGTHDVLLSFFQNLKTIIKEEQKPRVYLSEIKDKYRKRFLKSVPVGDSHPTLRSLLQKAHDHGHCLLKVEEDGCTWFVESKSNLVFQNLSRLLNEQMKKSMNISQLKPLYRDRYGEAIPIPDGQKLIDLLKEAEQEGHCRLVAQRGGNWSILSDK